MARASTWSCCVVAISFACAPQVPFDEGEGADGGGTGGASGHETSGAVTLDPTASTTPGSSTCADDVTSGCAAKCASFVACGELLENEFEGCVMNCLGLTLLPNPPECHGDLCAASQCFAALDCEQRELGGPDWAACRALSEQAGQACIEVAGACESWVNVEDDSCALECDGEVARRMHCVGAACTCFQDEVEVGSCPDAGVCDRADYIEVHAADCCGW